MVPRTWHGCLLLGVLGAAACIDAEHDTQVAALGAEDGSPGPTHRPGQPCLVCHGGSGPASLTLSIGGTVYDTQGQAPPSGGASVQIEDVDGHVFVTMTNDAGNFFLTPQQFTPRYPIQMQVTSPDGTMTQQMLTHSSRDGSCADCHYNPPGPTSAGPVWVYPAAPPTGM
jgi:hypothetical protein